MGGKPSKATPADRRLKENRALPPRKPLNPKPFSTPTIPVLPAPKKS